MLRIGFLARNYSSASGGKNLSQIESNDQFAARYIISTRAWKNSGWKASGTATALHPNSFPGAGAHHLCPLITSSHSNNHFNPFCKKKKTSEARPIEGIKWRH